MQRALIFSTSLFFLTSLAPHVQAVDKVYGFKGVPQQGTITEITRQNVVVEVNGDSKKIEAIDVLKVSFDEDPDALTKAREAALAGQLEQARADLKAINIKDVGREEIKTEIAYFIAYCEAKLALSGSGNRETAAKSLVDFVTSPTGRSSFHFYEGAELAGDLYLALGDFANATKYYGGLSKAPWPSVQLRATLLEGRSLQGQKNFAEALGKYDAVVKSGENSAEAQRSKQLARVGKATCLFETNKAEESKTILDDIIKNEDAKDLVLFGRVYNALGNYHLKAGRQKDALLAFLHTDLLFYKDGDAHAEALYNLTQLFSAINKADRAIDARAKLKQAYGASAWAQKLDKS